MPLVSMRQILDEAAKGGYGVGAFNVNNMEQIQAIMEAARETKSPVIVQASRGARSYTNDRFLYHLMMAATEIYPEIPDRSAPGSREQPGDLQVGDRDGIYQCDDGRLADGRRQDAVELSSTTSSVTREVVEMAHERGVTVEGELGTLGRHRGWARRGRRRAGAPHRSRSGRRIRRDVPESMRSRSPSERATVHTSSRRSPRATCW